MNEYWIIYYIRCLRLWLRLSNYLVPVTSDRNSKNCNPAHPCFCLARLLPFSVCKMKHFLARFWLRKVLEINQDDWNWTMSVAYWPLISLIVILADRSSLVWTLAGRWLYPFRSADGYVVCSDQVSWRIMWSAECDVLVAWRRSTSETSHETTSSDVPVDGCGALN